MEQILGMIPGLGSQIQNAKVDDKAFTRIEAIINSMTIKERQFPKILNGSRRKRIASGSVTRVQDVNQLLNQFGQMKKMMKNFTKMAKKGKGGMPGMPGGANLDQLMKKFGKNFKM